MFVGKKKEKFYFSAKLMPKLVFLANAVVIDSVFFFKSSNVAITNCGFEFNSIAAVKDSDICVFYLSPSSSFLFLPPISELLQVQLPLSWITVFGKFNSNYRCLWHLTI